MTNASASTRTTFDFMLPLLIEMEMNRGCEPPHSTRRTTTVTCVWLQRLVNADRTSCLIPLRCSCDLKADKLVNALGGSGQNIKSSLPTMIQMGRESAYGSAIQRVMECDINIS